MATVADTDRAIIVTEMLQNVPRDVNFGLNKPDLHAMVNAVDTVLDANRVALNTAIIALNPQWAGLSALSRAYIIILLLARRYRVGA